jgi:hypothetical protein
VLTTSVQESPPSKNNGNINNNNNNTAAASLNNTMTSTAAAVDSSCLYDAMTANLGPLLEKHKAKQEIAFEDLISAKQASDKICESMGEIYVVVSVVSFGSYSCTCDVHFETMPATVDLTHISSLLFANLSFSPFLFFEYLYYHSPP